MSSNESVGMDSLSSSQSSDRVKEVEVELSKEDHFDVKDLKDNSKQQGGKKILLSYFSSQREKAAPDSAVSNVPSTYKQLLKSSPADETVSRSATIKVQTKASTTFKLLSKAIGFFIRSFKAGRRVDCSDFRNLESKPDLGQTVPKSTSFLTPRAVPRRRCSWSKRTGASKIKRSTADHRHR